MTITPLLKSPTFFVSVSFAAGALNFIDSFARLVYTVMIRAYYPLGVYLKPVFFFAQALSLLLFIISVRFVRNPLASSPKLSRFLSVQMLLGVVVIILYVDFQLSELARISAANTWLQLALYSIYLVALSGTSLWFAFELLHQNKWKWLSVVFVLIGLAFITAFMEPMFFWTQNNLDFVFPRWLILSATYAPLIFMFLAAISTVTILLVQIRAKGFPLSLKLALLLFLPAFLLPFLWDSYKDGIINFVIRDVFYIGFGYSGSQWYSVSFYLMSAVAYVVVWRILKRASDRTLAPSLIILGVASFPWNGVVLLRAGYSSIIGNIISLSAVITGASLLKNWRA